MACSGGDGVASGRGDALLERADLVGQVRLVAHGGGHAAQQRGDLGAGLREAEDVVDEQQHVRGFCTSRKYSAMVSAVSGTRRRVPGCSSIWPKTSAVFSRTPASLHLADEVVALTGTLADAREHGARRRGSVATSLDHLLDQHGLADACAAEQTDLAALHDTGSSRSMTLMPVSNIWVLRTSSWSNAGGSRWMGHACR